MTELTKKDMKRIKGDFEEIGKKAVAKKYNIAEACVTQVIDIYNKTINGESR